MRDSRGFIYSTTLHGIILFLLIVGLPDFFHHTVEMEPEAISVDILPVAPMSNVRPQEKTPEKEQKKPEKQQRTEKKEVPEAKQQEPKPEEKPEPIPAKEVVKRVEKKPEKKQPEKKKEDDLSSILKSIKNEAKAEESKKPAQAQVQPNQHAAKSDRYDSSLPLSMSEKDGIKQQIEINWAPPIGAKDAYNLKVTLHIELSQDGTVIKVELAQDQSRYNSDSFFRAAADSAIRAVQRSSPLKNLPPDKYGGSNGWGDMEVTFDPKDLL